MIDTVCLLIPKEKMRFIEGVSNWELYSKTDQYKKFVRNPSKLEKDTGNYFPRLTGYKRNFSQEANVRVEFSVPKLLYLNNLDEVEDKNLVEVVYKLQERLHDMGVILTKSVIENASVSSVHFSKNILLKDGYTVSHIISELSKIDLRKTFDFAKTRFINNGQSLYAHTTSHQLTIYDKIADLGKDKKRAIDKDQTLYQRNLFSLINNNDYAPKEIIRFEIRLNHKQKMNKVIEDLGFAKNPSFKDVFNSELSKSVVCDYWNKIIKEKNLGLLSVSISLKDILQIIFLVDKKIKPKQAIYFLGLYMLAKDEDGMRQLRSMVTKRMHDRTWYRMAKDMRYASELITKNNLKSWVKQIDKSLEDYKTYKIKKI
ncbi:MAG: hypothetical protein V1851_00390 [Patescibacteria group bacterium]